MSLTLLSLQVEQAAWATRNFGPAPKHRSLLGVVEEIGELHAAIIAANGERWLPVRGYEGWYEVSELGRVRRAAPGKSTKVGRPKKFARHQQGYLNVTLSNGKKSSARRFFVHVVVAEAFIGPKPTGFEVNHKNGNKADNAIFNLEYVTRIENQKHAVDMGFWKPFSGEKHSLAKLSSSQVALVRAATGKHGEIAKEFGVSRSLISKIKAGQIWTTKHTITAATELGTYPSEAVAAIGRLSHAHLKNEQKIDGSPDKHRADKVDAIGDTVIFLADYCTREGIDLEQAVEDTWSRVKLRDYQKDPQNGGRQ